MRAKAAIAGVLALAMAGFAAAKAAAEDSSWPRFPGSAYAAQGDPSERAFIKEWEAAPPKGYPTLSTSNIAPMQAAIRRYAEIAASGGWAAFPEVFLQPGMVDPAVELLRTRLLLSGDLQERGAAQAFDYYLEKALRRYQASNGLPPTGILDKHTILALNVPAAARLKQLKENLARLIAYGRPGRKYVVVNIPSAQIEAIEADRVVSRHSGVVGPEWSASRTVRRRS